MEEQNEIRLTVVDYWHIIWRRKWMIALFVLTTTIVVIIGSFITAPIYQASVILHIKKQTQTVLGGDLLGSGISIKEEINTQIEILKSRSVLENAVTEQNILETFEISEDLNDEEKLLAAMAQLRKDISVVHLTNTQLIRISYSSRDPELARDICNTISRSFIERNLQSKRAEATAVLSFVSSQMEQVSERLNRAEEELLDYKQAEGISILDSEARLQVDRLSQLESLYQGINIEREILGTRINAVLNQMEQDVPASQDTLSDDPVIKRKTDELTSLQEELARIGSKASPDRSRIDDINERIDNIKEEIKSDIERSMGIGMATGVNSALNVKLAELQSQDIVLAAQEDALISFVEELEEDITKLPAQEIGLIRLERVRRINDELYATLTRARNEAQLEAASTIGNIDIIETAATPFKAVYPRKRENVIMGLLISLFISIGLAFILEYLDNSVKSEDELKNLLGIPLLGYIPQYNGEFQNNTTTRGKPNKARDFTLEILDNPRSHTSEEFRLLGANLRFVDIEKDIKTIVITSPFPGDGKTTIAANLAIALASREERVLIVDTDFRMPAIHKIFKIPNNIGITNILAEGLSYKTAIGKIDGEGSLDILTCGPIPPNPSEVIVSRKMDNLIEEMKEEYDRIIFDVPPVFGATDALMLGSNMDGTLVVIKSGHIDKRAIKRFRDLYSTTQTRILGGVLNKVDPKDGRFGHSFYYYYSEAYGSVKKHVSNR